MDDNSTDVTSTEWRKIMTDKLIHAMGNKKFCSTCRKDQPVETGFKTKFRWLCKNCNDKRINFTARKQDSS